MTARILRVVTRISFKANPIKCRELQILLMILILVTQPTRRQARVVLNAEVEVVWAGQGWDMAALKLVSTFEIISV